MGRPRTTACLLLLACVLGAGPLLAQVNTAPQISAPASAQTTWATPYAFGNTVTISDDAAPADILKLTIEVQKGAVSMGGSGGLSFAYGDGQDDRLLSCTGTLAAINAALDGLAYSPVGGVTGTDVIWIGIDDLGSGGTNGPRQNSVYVQLSIIAPDGEIQLEHAGFVLPDNSVELIQLAVARVNVFIFKVRNLGPEELYVAGSSIRNTHNCVVAVSTQLPPVIQADTFELLILEVTPGAVGAFAFELVIVNSDHDENPFDLYVTGQAAHPGPAPEVAGCSTGEHSGWWWLVLFAIPAAMWLRRETPRLALVAPRE
jgi:hypothetical protein